MRIVMAANWWYRRGGLGAVMIDEANQLQAAGHSVFPFAAAHPDNLPTPSSLYFPPFVETANLGQEMSLGMQVSSAVRLAYNRDAARGFDALLHDVKPDLVHLHNTARQLSPSIVAVASRRGVPVVMTLHDYGLVCPQGQLYKGEREACLPPNCLGGNVIHAVTNRCIKGSLAGSAVAAVEHLVHRSLGMYARRARILFAPSRFMYEVVRGAGVPGAKLRLLRNGLPSTVPPGPPPDNGGHVLFAGRLSREKGLEVLIAAARQTPEVRYLVAGDGPLRDGLEDATPANVELIGHQSQRQLHDLYRNAVAIVVPSTWFENAPLTVLEGMRAARAVIASDIGGLGEMLELGGGQLVPTGDVDALAAAVRAVWSDRALATTLGAEGRQSFSARYLLETHMTSLLAFYEEAMRT